jgi:hypothetical protein
MKKVCTRCGKKKDINDFYHNFGNKDTYSNICKKCQQELSKEWVEKNRERKAELNRLAYARRKAEFYNGLNQDNN